MQGIDLFLGSDLGFWVIDRVSSNEVRRVFTFDSGIARLASEQGIEVFEENPNRANFTPSEIGFSVHYPRILQPHLLRQYYKVYNLHPGYLPWGRGYYPIFWAIWEQTPAGATLHEITAGIDEGPIVAQLEVAQYPWDTGGSLFERVREAERQLFTDYWPRIVAGENLPSRLQEGTGSYHSKKDFYRIKQECEWWNLNTRDFMRLVRALSFPGFTGLEISIKGFRFEVCLKELRQTEGGTED